MWPICNKISLVGYYIALKYASSANADWPRIRTVYRWQWLSAATNYNKVQWNDWSETSSLHKL